MAASPTLATIAEYFRIGLQVGLLSPERASDWATSEIARMEDPPYELIEVSWSKGLASTLEALSSVQGERDKHLAGRWLLGQLRESLPHADAELQLAARQAMQVARAAELGDETYYRFDMVDDELSLARTKVYGTVEECRVNLLKELAGYQLAQLHSDA
jgi:hypothetical protein